MYVLRTFLQRSAAVATLRSCSIQKCAQLKTADVTTKLTKLSQQAGTSLFIRSCSEVTNDASNKTVDKNAVTSEQSNTTENNALAHKLAEHSGGSNDCDSTNRKMAELSGRSNDTVAEHIDGSVDTVEDARESKQESADGTSTPKWNSLDELRVLLMKEELEMRFHSGDRVPRAVKEKDMRRLVENTHYKKRTRLLTALFKMEKVAEKKARRMQLKQELEEDEENTGRRRVLFKASRRSTDNNLYFAERHGPHLVFDMDYTHVMSAREIVGLGRQFEASWAYNRLYRDPFHFHFTGVSDASLRCVQNFQETVGVTVSLEDYNHFYEHHQLVYLTPDARKTLESFDENCVYIIGGLLDRNIRSRESYSKAKQQGLQMARLPLDRYLKFDSGSKVMTVDQVVKILIDYKSTECWPVALRHVPTRKLSQDFLEKRRLYNEDLKQREFNNTDKEILRNG